MSEVLFETNNQVATITIHRPEALNALNSAVLSGLSKTLDELDARIHNAKDIRAVIVQGAGPKAFVAGADIKEMNGLNRDQARAFAERGQKVFRRFEILDVPVIASVQGFALGGGCELALACDFIYASEGAKFGLPEVTLGLIPGFGGTQRLAKVVGLNKAREMIFTGSMLSAQEALQVGLVNKVLADEAALKAEVIKVAETIASRGPIAVREAKKAVLQGYVLDIDSGLELERDAFGELFGFSDVKEGLSAFVEKRKPNFKGT